jgi:hypothetical protein
MMTSNTNKSLHKSEGKSSFYIQGSVDSSGVSVPVRQITIRYITEDTKLQRGYIVYMTL